MDIRQPIGAFFSLVGVLLIAQDLLSGPGASGGSHLNSTWGAVLLAFGGGMLLLVRRSRRAGSSR